MSRSIVLNQIGDELSAEIKEFPQKEFEQNELLVGLLDPPPPNGI